MVRAMSVTLPAKRVRSWREELLAAYETSQEKLRARLPWPTDDDDDAAEEFI